MINIQITVEDENLDRDKLSKAVDQEIQEFDDKFVGLFDGAEPLAQFERAIIKTYLMFKLDSPKAA